MVLIQEQLSKNRIIVELDGNKNVTASVTSSTHERKSRTNVVMTHGRIRLKHNSLTENVPIVVAFKAMGFTSDQEIVGLVGTEREIQDALAQSLEEAAALKVFSQRQALAYMGSKIKTSRGRMGRSARTRDPVVRDGDGGALVAVASTVIAWSPGPADVRRVCDFATLLPTLLAVQEEARSVLERLIICHVEVTNFNFRPKALYLARMIRRVLLTIQGKTTVDDKVRQLRTHPAPCVTPLVLTAPRPRWLVRRRIIMATSDWSWRGSCCPSCSRICSSVSTRS